MMLAAYILLLIVGMGVGYALRQREKFIRVVGLMITPVVWFILFLVGITIGSNKVTLSEMHDIVWRSVLIGLSATAGSIVAAWIVYHLLFRKTHP